MLSYDVFGSLLYGISEGRTLSAIARDAISFEAAGQDPDDALKTVSEMTAQMALNILQVGLDTFDIDDIDWLSRDGFSLDLSTLCIDQAYNLVDHVTVPIPDKTKPGELQTAWIRVAVTPVLNSQGIIVKIGWTPAKGQGEGAQSIDHALNPKRRHNKKLYDKLAGNVKTVCVDNPTKMSRVIKDFFRDVYQCPDVEVKGDDWHAQQLLTSMEHSHPQKKKYTARVSYIFRMMNGQRYH